MKRVFLFVLDSCGCGELPDAASFGDFGVNTIKRIAGSPEFRADNLLKMGIGNIEGLSFLKAQPHPSAMTGRMAERSAGKDTTIGHWEIAGLISDKPLPTYPNGFPGEVLDAFSSVTGRGVLCNKTYSGTEVIRDYGEEHIATGKLIVYTSADSVFQIAAHEDVVPTELLFEYCRAARKILTGEHAVGRVIARPFTGKYPFTRTANRHDFSLEPPGKTLLDALKEAGKAVYAIGKIADIFADRGVTEKVYTHSNAEGMDRAYEALSMDFEGLCFINLVDYDMLYGHRRDIDGYAKAFAAFDDFLPRFTASMREDDLLIITADHGCDPGYLATTDHTREYTPLILYGGSVKPGDAGTRETFADIAATTSAYLGVPFDCPGKSLING